MTSTQVEKRLRIAAVFVMVGLGIELVSLSWHHPTSFIFFVVLGGLCMAAGILMYLHAIVSRGA